MAFALAEEQKQFIVHLVRSGRFNNQSEVVREALRRMAESELSYLTPPPLTPAQIEEIYGGSRDDAEEERAFGGAAFAAVRRAARKGKKP